MADPFNNITQMYLSSRTRCDCNTSIYIQFDANEPSKLPVGNLRTHRLHEHYLAMVARLQEEIHRRMSADLRTRRNRFPAKSQFAVVHGSRIPRNKQCI